MGSIPTRSRHFFFVKMLFQRLLLCFCCATPPILAAQRVDSARVVPAAAPQPRDTLAPPISSKRAFLYSLAVPGLGQARLDRPTAGALYAAFEIASVGMLAKSSADLRLARRRVKERVVNSYEVDENGRPKFDAKTGAIIVKDTVNNRYAESAPDQQQRSRLKARQLHYEDWVAFLLFNHLFSAADAFVSAQLWDLPKRLEVRALPNRGVAVGLHLTFRG